MGINSATMKFKEDLLSLVTKSGLPICNVEMVMTTVLSAVRVTLSQAIVAEKKAEEAKEEEADG